MDNAYVHKPCAKCSRPDGVRYASALFGDLCWACYTTRHHEYRRRLAEWAAKQKAVQDD